MTYISTFAVLNGEKQYQTAGHGITHYDANLSFLILTSKPRVSCIGTKTVEVWVVLSFIPRPLGLSKLGFENWNWHHHNHSDRQTAFHVLLMTETLHTCSLLCWHQQRHSASCNVLLIIINIIQKNTADLGWQRSLNHYGSFIFFGTMDTHSSFFCSLFNLLLSYTIQLWKHA